MSIPALIVLVLLVLLFLVGLRTILSHFRGQGGCCGGTASPPPNQKKLAGLSTSRRRMTIEGMSCMHCVNHVTQALNALDGVAAEVHLNPSVAIIDLEHEVPDETLRQAVLDAGFQVTAIEKMV